MPGTYQWSTNRCWVSKVMSKQKFFKIFRKEKTLENRSIPPIPTDVSWFWIRLDWIVAYKFRPETLVKRLNVPNVIGTTSTKKHWKFICAKSIRTERVHAATVWQVSRFSFYTSLCSGEGNTQMHFSCKIKRSTTSSVGSWRIVHMWL